MHLAARGGHLAVAGLLLSRSTEQLQTADKQGRTPLHMAAAQGHKEMVGLLLGQGADINVADSVSLTSFFLCYFIQFIISFNQSDSRLSHSLFKL